VTDGRDLFDGRYRIERILWVRRDTQTFAARDLTSNSKVSLEVFVHHRLCSADAVAQVIWHLGSSFRIESEHVLRIFDVSVSEEGLPYIIREPLEGIALDGWIRAQGPLPVEHAVDLIVQTCDALASAHAKGIVHRDIKPANLLAVEQPCTEAVRSDAWMAYRGGDNSSFRLSIKVLGWHSKPNAVVFQSRADQYRPLPDTRLQMLFGTPLYMSPEQLTGMCDADRRTDIWSIGATLYELVTGRALFEGNDLTELLVRILGEPPRLQKGSPQLPVGLEAIILKCLQKKARWRYQSVAELTIALAEFGSERAKPLVDRIRDFL
jgi:eukaryotic-like serine/threonine-protein kinase